MQKIKIIVDGVEPNKNEINAKKTQKFSKKIKLKITKYSCW